MLANSPFIVAEISANHGSSIDVIKQTMDRAKKIGCDAVKIQTYTPDTITLDCDNEYFKIDTGTIWDGTTLYNLYQKSYTPWEWHEELFDYARRNNIDLFSTPFDFKAVDLLEKCGNPRYKIASFEITDVPLIEYAASKGKPMIISTGIATEEEIKEAIEACYKVDNHDVTLLKCTSQYPAKLEDANLNTMVDMRERFNVKVGLSDHTESNVVAFTAAALGAEVIEKHFILDKKIGGPDASFSLEPDKFCELIEGVQQTCKALGFVTYEMNTKKAKDRKYARSLFVVQDVKAGQQVTAKNVRSIRPSYGMAPKYYNNILGKYFVCDVERGTPLLKTMLDFEPNDNA